MTQTTPTTNPPLVCWNCHERAQGTHFCPSCGKLQQIAGSDRLLRALRHAPQAVDRNECARTKIPATQLEAPSGQFRQRHRNERELSLKRSSELNDAYRTLRDPVARVEYLLALEDMRKEGEHKQQAPPELLEEVFELNESLDELREAKSAGDDLTALKSRLRIRRKKFRRKASRSRCPASTTAAQTGTPRLTRTQTNPARKKIMSRLNELLNRRSYIRNLVVTSKRNCVREKGTLGERLSSAGNGTASSASILGRRTAWWRISTAKPASRSVFRARTAARSVPRSSASMPMAASSSVKPRATACSLNPSAPSIP